jgi:phosphatidylserine/phosphatidylglycerophosphate/cardiolipin synthase-like enzyme
MRAPLALLLLVAACVRRPPEDTGPRETGFTRDTSETGDTGTGPAQVAWPLLDHAYDEAALEAIDAAAGRVHMVEFLVVDQGPVHTLLQHLVRAAERGVDVAVLADEESDSTAESLAWLAEAGVRTQLDSPERTTHDKLIVADDTVLVGSHNLTSSALEENTEASALIEDQAVAAWFEAIFQEQWASPADFPSLAAADLGSVRTLHNPDVDDELHTRLEAATGEVRVLMYAISCRSDAADPVPCGLLYDLVAAASRGVDVAVILDDSEWSHDNDINSESTRRLTEAGIPVRLTARDHVTHAKVEIIDGVVLVGDANWSDSGMEYYQGVTVALSDPRAVDGYREWFEILWSAATPAR